MSLVDLNKGKIIHGTGTVVKIVLPKDYGLPELFMVPGTMMLAGMGSIIPESFSYEEGKLPVKHKKIMLQGVPFVSMEIDAPVWWDKRNAPKISQ